MRSEEIRARGAALADRIRTQVDTSERLENMFRVHRRRRLMAVAAATAMVLAVLVGVLMLARGEEQPVVTVPPTTVPSTEAEVRSLPVEVFMVLRGTYTVDDATGICEGSGPLAGIGEGAAIHIFDETVFESADDAPTIALPDGEEITVEDSESSFLLSRGESAACVFTLPDLGHDIADYETISLFPEADPDVSSGSSISGLRVVYSFGESEPGPSVDLPAEAVASEDPETLQDELTSLTASAGPGTIVGFVNMSSETSTGAPTSPSQPLCVGAGVFEKIMPGNPVVVADEDGEVVGEGMLRGSAFDAHLGCSLWFNVDVPPNLTVYAITVADHPPVIFDLDVLEQFGWRIDLWTDASHMQPNCVELEEGAEPMTCVLVESR